jgi:hypothetical protein
LNFSTPVDASSVSRKFLKIILHPHLTRFNNEYRQKINYLFAWKPDKGGHHKPLNTGTREETKFSFCIFVKIDENNGYFRGNFRDSF